MRTSLWQIGDRRIVPGICSRIIAIGRVRVEREGHVNVSTGAIDKSSLRERHHEMGSQGVVGPGGPLIQSDVINFERAGHRWARKAAKLVDFPTEVRCRVARGRDRERRQGRIGIRTWIIPVKGVSIGSAADKIDARAVSDRDCSSQSFRQGCNRCPGGPIKFVGIGNGHVARGGATKTVKIAADTADGFAADRDRIYRRRTPGAETGRGCRRRSGSA